MCGIAGMIDPAFRGDTADLEATAEAMANRLSHRGPDGAGTWVNAPHALALAHRRLAIIDLSETGRQPMESETGRYAITLNGEIYNFPELRSELAAKGACFRGHSDTEVLLAAIEAWGLEGALDRSIGMFAFAVWDRDRGLLHLARDRAGEKPLCYAWVGRAFLFASELRAFYAHPRFNPPIDRVSLQAFLRWGYIPAPRTIYEGVHKLPPGTWLTVRPDEGPGAPPRAYWSLRNIIGAQASASGPGPAASLVDAVEAALTRAVKRCMVSDVPLGVFLSGGVDSSTVTALMQAASDRPVRTFTIGFLEEGYDEAPYARAVAKHLGTEHREYYVTGNETLAVVPELASIYDEPFADSSQIPTLLVARAARQHVTVCLSGDGGDELFAGYNRHFQEENVFRWTDRLPAGMRRAATRAIRAIPPEQWDGWMRRFPRATRGWGTPGTFGSQVHRAAALLALSGPAARYESLTTIWEEVPHVVVGGPFREGNGVRVPGLLPAHPVLAAMTRDFEEYLPGDVLVKVDRASMAVSLETRAPFLNHDIVELAWRLPVQAKIRGGCGKWILRQILKRHLPERLVERPKAGFTVPLAAWLRGPLRSWGEELLDERRLAREGYLDPVLVRRGWKAHQAGTHNWADPLWCVLMFQSWLASRRGPSGAGQASGLRGNSP